MGTIGPFKSGASFNLAADAGAWDITGIDADLIHTTGGPTCAPGGIFEGEIVGFAQTSGRQFVQCDQEFATQALRNAAFFAQENTAGLLCNGSTADDFNLVGWEYDPFPSDVWFHTGSGVGSCETYYVSMGALSSPFRIRWQFFLGGSHTYPNPSTYWADLGWQTTDDIYYNI
jgi:hypothetical protein